MAPTTTDQAKPKAAKIRPTWGPSEKPVACQALPMESAWPGPWLKPKGNMNPKPGCSTSPLTATNTSTPTRPMMPCMTAVNGMPMAMERAPPTALGGGGVWSPTKRNSSARPW